MEHVKKHSKKRDAILQCIRQTKCHPTAEWVYNRLKPEIPDLSLGTVYRNLALFKAEGEIQSVGVVAGQERYDGDTRPHTHFVCTDCGEVTDLEGVTLPQEVLTQAAKDLGGDIESYQLQFTGRCAGCCEA